MKIFKNRFFIIVLSIAIFFVILTSTLSIMGQTDPIKDAVNTVTMPVRYVFTKINESIQGFFKYFQSIDDLYKENGLLKEEIERLEGLLADADAAKNENQRLREYLEVKKTYPDFKMTDALIVGREGDGIVTFLTLDRGSGDGIEVGMPVIVRSGVVGSVCEVGYAWCRVRLVNESSASAGAYVDRSGENGIVSGDVAFKDTGYCTLEYLGEDADVEVDDIVYTNGEGSVYPRGLPVGRVTDVRVDKYLRTKVATVECFVDFESLRYVMIITDFEILQEEGSDVQ